MENQFLNFNPPPIETKYDNITPEDKTKLFTKVKHVLGFPNRIFELSEEQMTTYLEIAIEDFSAFLNSWLITQNWGNLQYIGVSASDFMTAYTTKTLDFERSFTYAYSKQVGLGNDNPSQWELKKDYVVIQENQQVYEIPAGREVNEVLWSTPPFINSAGANSMDAFSFGLTNGNWTYFGRPAQFIQPSYSIMLAANDFSLKRRIQGSELTYRITAGENGKKNLWLYPVPGGRNEITSFGVPRHLAGTYVWYFYYDTTPQNKTACLEQNKDIILTPAQVPLKNITWKMMNDISQSRIRRLLVAECKMAIGNIRGFASGELKAGDFMLTMDYRHLLDEGEKEKTAVYEEMKLELEKITYKTLMEDRASIAENLNKVLQFIPFQDPLMRM